MEAIKNKRMHINGNTVVVEKSAKELFTFFTDLKNFEGIMPENIQKFEVDGTSFIFGLPGMPEIRLVLKEKTEFSNITSVSYTHLTLPTTPYV